MVGGLLGGKWAGLDTKYSRRFWMMLITQAGVGLALTKKLEQRFGDWAEGFVTMTVFVISK